MTSKKKLKEHGVKLRKDMEEEQEKLLQMKKELKGHLDEVRTFNCNLQTLMNTGLTCYDSVKQDLNKLKNEKKDTKCLIKSYEQKINDILAGIECITTAGKKELNESSSQQVNLEKKI